MILWAVAERSIRSAEANVLPSFEDGRQLPFHFVSSDVARHRSTHA